MSYLGVRELIAELKPEFDRVGKATKIAKAALKDRGEKADKDNLRIEIDLVLAEWDAKRDLGIKIQEELCQKELKSNPNSSYEGYSCNIFDSKIPFVKSDSKLENNKVYLEKKLVSNKYGLIGFADYINVSRGTINITDNKVLDKLYRSSSYKTDTGFQIVGEKMYEPLEHLDNCNYNDAVLQLSLYMYLAWENNKNLKIGKLFIRHIKVNEKGKKTKDELIPVPYMKNEVKKILKYKLLNNED
jgi:hypothetical protein